MPPNIRFLRENVLVLGLYCGNNKPDMSHIMVPLAEEMQTLQRCGIFTWHNSKMYHFIPIVMFCACDLPARSEVQNVKLSNGYYGCPVCVQKGTMIKDPKTGHAFVRFLKEIDTSEIRTHEMAVNVCSKVMHKKDISNEKGFKGVPCMIAFKDFDLARGYAIDYMHGVNLGIMKALLDIWLGARKLHYFDDEEYKFKPLTLEQRKELNRRIIALKPPTRIRHKPKPIFDRSYYTANEYRSIIWYYMRFSLLGLLKKELIKHFCLLSDATYILSKAKIKRSEVESAGEMLRRFADQWEKFYGKNSITINIHLLRHYTYSVLNTGPLWTQSMFCFESNIGELKRSFNSTVDVVEQVAINYSMRAASEGPNNEDRVKDPQILRIKEQIVNPIHEYALATARINVEPNKMLKIGYEMRWKKEVYKSSLSVTTKSVDNFIQMDNGTIGMIEFFFEADKPYVMIKKYERMKIYNHLVQVQPHKTDIFGVYRCDSIHRKLIYLKYTYSNVAFIEIITIEPNPFEGN